MIKRICTGKISKAVVTDAELDYEGSLGIDSTILEASGILPWEMVLVANVSNGQRLETYTIPEAAGSGKIALYGAAARLGQPGHEVIIMAWSLLEETEARAHPGPRVVRLADGNKLP